MKIRFTPEQVKWLREITGEETAQDAVNFFLDCMKKEDIATSEFMTLLELLMRRKILPPGKD